jgi:hypothetical protein
VKAATATAVTIVTFAALAMVFVMSVNGRTGRVADAFDLILQHQLPALQLNDVEVVCRTMLEGIVQFVFQNFVLTFQFNEMRLDRHMYPPLLIDFKVG